MNNLAISLRPETQTRVFVDLGVENKDEILAHHMKLSPKDRRLRFMFTMNDETLKNFIDRIDYVCHRAFGAYSLCDNGTTQLVGFGLLTFDDPKTPEIALSVDPDHRNRGHGLAIMNQAVTYAKERKCTRLKVVCDIANTPMQDLAAKIGFRLRHNECDEYEGYLSLV